MEKTIKIDKAQKSDGGRKTNKVKRIWKFVLVCGLFLIFAALMVISAKQPTEGRDSGTWGGILNRYLNISHTENGSLKVGLNASFNDFNVTNQFMYLGTELNLWIMARFVNLSWTNVTYDAELHNGTILRTDWTNVTYDAELDNGSIIRGGVNESWINDTLDVYGLTVQLNATSCNLTITRGVITGYAGCSVS